MPIASHATTQPPSPATGYRIVLSGRGGIFLTHPVGPKPQVLDIGRAHGCHLRVDDPTVSGRHLQLFCEPQGPIWQFSIIDPGSTHGVFVEGLRIERHQPTPLIPGVPAQFGNFFLFIQPDRGDDSAANLESALLQGPATCVTGQMLEPASPVLSAAARSRLTVLILGETGVGKEVLARRLHALSPRAKLPFVAINCGTIPSQLFEGELFGYKRGAYTEAHRDKPGLLESAHGGTVFLDEIGDIDESHQVKLLRFLQDGEVRPVGGLISKKIDVRVIAATNRPLHDPVATPQVRRDLYFRLAKEVLLVPPLRDRRDEIRPLADRFIEKWCADQGRPPATLSARALSALLAYSWPGNVRELESMLEVAVAHLDDSHEIDLKHLRFLGAASPFPAVGDGPLQTALRQQEKAKMEQALAEHGGKAEAAARSLGMAVSTFYYKRKKYGI